jgi:hypothetical protein
MYCLSDYPIKTSKAAESMIASYLHQIKSPPENMCFLPSSRQTIKSSDKQSNQANQQTKKSYEAGIFVAADPAIYDAETNGTIVVGDFSSFFPGMVNLTSNICAATLVPEDTVSNCAISIHTTPCGNKVEASGEDRFSPCDVRSSFQIEVGESMHKFLDHDADTPFNVLPSVMAKLVKAKDEFKQKSLCTLHHASALKAMADESKRLAVGTIGCIASTHSPLNNYSVASAVYSRQRSFLARMVNGFGNMRTCATCLRTHHFLNVDEGGIEECPTCSQCENPVPQDHLPLIAITADSLTFLLSPGDDPDTMPGWVIDQLHQHYVPHEENGVAFTLERVANKLLQLQDRSQIFECRDGSFVYKGSSFNQQKDIDQRDLNRLVGRILMGHPPNIEEAEDQLAAFVNQHSVDTQSPMQFAAESKLSPLRNSMHAAMAEDCSTEMLTDGVLSQRLAMLERVLGKAKCRKRQRLDKTKPDITNVKVNFGVMF